MVAFKLPPPLYQFITNEVIPNTGIKEEKAWESLQRITDSFTPIAHQLLERREKFQSQINSWVVQHFGKDSSLHDYIQYLIDIGYLLPECRDFHITTEQMDPEVSNIASPQLVVPVKNSRYALNAANARWGSLYAALYRSDVIITKKDAKDPDQGSARELKVIEFGTNFLDETFPLESSTHREVAAYSINDQELVCKLQNGGASVLCNRDQFVGYRGEPGSPSGILLKNHGLHVEIVIDNEQSASAGNSAVVKDILVEAALTNIQDFEDSVSAVDAEDKVGVYSNWLGLMKGDLSEKIIKNGKEILRRLVPDRQYISKSGQEIFLPSRSLMFARVVGLHMFTDVVLTEYGEEIPEIILDSYMATLIAIQNLAGGWEHVNSRQGNIYIVVPKLHGPEEVAFVVKLFEQIEEALGLKQNTIKLGLMNEERRTSLNLKQCIYEARSRIFFINTGFLDRTGDEIHTLMKVGPMAAKNTMKNQRWFQAYEDHNVVTGLKCGFKGKAQIGKGMWTAPDEMSQMLDEKIVQLQSGANCAWVPSPSAAVLHALHYHQVDVSKRQEELINAEPIPIEQLVAPPLLVDKENISDKDIQKELDNNIQGILGYVVHWITQGVGCSKVLDINGTALMEDRATLRISSQHVANWLHHGVCNLQQVDDSLKRMAIVVDQQNIHDPNYYPMTKNLKNNIAFKTARELIIKGLEQSNGYTEAILHKGRKSFKQRGCENRNTLSLFYDLDSNYTPRFVSH